MKKSIFLILPLLLSSVAHAADDLKCVRTDRYVSMEKGRHPVTCNRRHSGPWEKFVAESAGGGYYYIKSTNNNKYLRRSGNQHLVTCTHSKNSSDDRMKWKILDLVTGVGLVNKSSSKALREKGSSWLNPVEVTSSRYTQKEHQSFYSGFPTSD